MALAKIHEEDGGVCNIFRVLELIKKSLREREHTQGDGLENTLFQLYFGALARFSLSGCPKAPNSQIATYK